MEITSVPSQRPGADDPLARGERVQRRGEGGPIRQGQPGSELQQRREDEAAARHLAVRQPQALVLDLDLSQDQEVDVERAGAVTGAAGLASALGLDLLAEVEQPQRLERGADTDRRVEEVGLVEELADRLGDVGRGNRLDLDPALCQQLDRGPQVAGAVADVRPQAEVAETLLSQRRRPPRPRPRPPRAGGSPRPLPRRPRAGSAAPASPP